MAGDLAAAYLVIEVTQSGAKSAILLGVSVEENRSKDTKKGNNQKSGSISLEGISRLTTTTLLLKVSEE